MTKKSINSIIERSKFIGFKNVAVNFAEGAKVAYEYEYYNAAGVLIIHASIASIHFSLRSKHSATFFPFQTVAE